jgi:hypothetical protein
MSPQKPVTPQIELVHDHSRVTTKSTMAGSCWSPMALMTDPGRPSGCGRICHL